MASQAAGPTAALGSHPQAGAARLGGTEEGAIGMSVRKRSWTTAKGEAKEAWIVTYPDAHADRVQETFARQKDAKAREAEIKVELGRGMRTARRKSITVEKAGELWLEAAKNRVERATYDHYRQHLVLHIVPHLGKLKLVDLSLAVVDSFETKVRQKVGRSTARKVLGSL